MVDPNVVYKHLQELEQCIKQLDTHKNVTVRDMVKDYDVRWIIERGMQLAIQNVLDISEHILVSLGVNNLDDYTTIIDKMGENKILSREFAKKIRGMAGLRNILVHDYIGIETKKLHNHLQNDLKDFRKFAKYITKYLKKS